MTSLDLSALTATDTAVPAATKRSNKVADSPFPGWVRETYENKTAKMVPVQASQVGEVRYAIRAAAKIEGLGSRIVLRDKDDKPLEWFSGDGEAYVAREKQDGTLQEVPQNTGVKVIFAGQEKRARKSKAEKLAEGEGGTADAEYEDETEDETEYEDA
jgi:hypothetical protein